MAVGLDLFEETVGLLGDLERRSIPYAVAGALALAIHGVPRATTDIDLLVQPEDVDARRSVARARGFGIEAISGRCPRHGLIQMKAWAGREQDLADNQRLQELDR